MSNQSFFGQIKQEESKKYDQIAKSNDIPQATCGFKFSQSEISKSNDNH